MSLGLGIFLSVVLLIVVWQVDKRSAWRKVGKVVLWLGALGGYVWWDSRSSRLHAAHVLADEVRRIKAGELGAYWGVKLGMSQDEVSYLKGWPTKRTDASGDTIAHWSCGDNYEHVVLWDDDGRVQGIVCNSKLLDPCERVAGVAGGTSESELIAALGPPATSPEFDTFAGKVYTYGAGTARWQFYLEREEVHAIVLSTENFKPKVTAAVDRAR